MSYRDQLQDTDAFDDHGTTDFDPRTYHHDPAPYVLTSRRFPEGVLVRRSYSLPDCACEVVQLVAPGRCCLAYAMPSELRPA